MLLGSPLRIPEGELGVSFVPKDLPKAPKREEGCFWEWRHQEVLEVEIYQLESLSETSCIRRLGPPGSCWCHGG